MATAKAVQAQAVIRVKAQVGESLVVEKAVELRKVKKVVSKATGVVRIAVEILATTH